MSKTVTRQLTEGSPPKRHSPPATAQGTCRVACESSCFPGEVGRPHVGGRSPSPCYVPPGNASPRVSPQPAVPFVPGSALHGATVGLCTLPRRSRRPAPSYLRTEQTSRFRLPLALPHRFIHGLSPRATRSMVTCVLHAAGTCAHESVPHVTGAGIGP